MKNVSKLLIALCICGLNFNALAVDEEERVVSFKELSDRIKEAPKGKCKVEKLEYKFEESLLGEEKFTDEYLTLKVTKGFKTKEFNMYQGSGVFAKTSAYESENDSNIEILHYYSKFEETNFIIVILGGLFRWKIEEVFVHVNKETGKVIKFSLKESLQKLFGEGYSEKEITCP